MGQMKAFIEDWLHVVASTGSASTFPHPDWPHSFLPDGKKTSININSFIISEGEYASRRITAWADWQKEIHIYVLSTKFIKLLLCCVYEKNIFLSWQQLSVFLWMVTDGERSKDDSHKMN